MVYKIKSVLSRSAVSSQTSFGKPWELPVTVYRYLYTAAID